MRHYFFDIDDGQAVTSDQIGLDLPSLVQVRQEAISALPTIAHDVMPDGDRRQMTVHARDDTGRYIFKATLTLQAEWLDGAPG